MRLQFLCLSVWIHLSCRWPSDSSTDRLVPVEEECLLGSLPLCVTLPWISCIVSKFSGHILRAVSYHVKNLFSCDNNLTSTSAIPFVCLSMNKLLKIFIHLYQGERMLVLDPKCHKYSLELEKWTPSRPLKKHFFSFTWCRQQKGPISMW